MAVSIDTFELGTEPHWSCRQLRLRGGPDLVSLGEDGGIDIFDYKTGSVVDEEGELVPQVTTQIRLYLLMAEYLSARRPVRAFVEHPEPQEVEWDDRARAETLKRLRAMSDRFPAGSPIDASAAAKAGIHCRGCRVRHRCETYLHTVPAWWSNDGGNPRPLPLDVWGILKGVERVGDTWTIRMLDADGRHIQVEGLCSAWPLRDLPVGVYLYLFNLEATQDLQVHGEYLHPRNFHEVAPGLQWPSALQVRMFRSTGE